MTPRARIALPARLAVFAPALPAAIALALAVALALPSPAASAPELEAGFRSIVEVLGPRAVWVNPAALGLGARPALLAEGGWRQARDTSGEDSWEASPATAGAAAGMGRSGWGAQWEGEDVRGAADWTFTVAQRRSAPGGASFGTAVEWHGGEDGALDATLGCILPIGRSLRASGVVRDLFESDRDGVPIDRTWQTGVAWLPRSLSGRLLWDAVWESGRSPDTIHRYGAVFAPPSGIRLRWLGDFDDEWDGSVGWDSGEALVEIGYRRVGSAPDGAWVSVEWRGNRIPR